MATAASKTMNFWQFLPLDLMDKNIELRIDTVIRSDKEIIDILL